MGNAMEDNDICRDNAELVGINSSQNFQCDLDSNCFLDKSHQPSEESGNLEVYDDLDLGNANWL